MTGVLQDEAGLPLGGAKVLACMATVCYSSKTNAVGRFSFLIDAPAAVVIKTEEDLTPAWRHAAAMAPTRLSEPRLQDIGTVHTPTLPEGRSVGPTRLDPQTIEIGDGLEVTLRRGSLDPPPGEVIDDLAARRLPDTISARYAALVGEKIVAVYALHPFAATSRLPIGLKAPSSLAAGTPVKFRTISELDGGLSDAVPGRASGTFVATDPAAGIRKLSYVIISR